MSYYYKRSFISEDLKVSVTAKSVTTMLKDLDTNRIPITTYFKCLLGVNGLILIDATSIVSYSEKLTKVEHGLTKSKLLTLSLRIKDRASLIAK